MLKLVILSPGMTGRTHELKVAKTTIGRQEDNLIAIAEPSVSGHHCEVLLRGKEAVVRDLDSTNGTFINGERVTEATLQPGQILRLGQIELRLETDVPPPPSRKQLDRTTVIPGGVSPSQLEMSAGANVVGTKGTGFSRKDNRGNQIFIIIAVIFGVVILALLIYISATIRK